MQGKPYFIRKIYSMLYGQLVVQEALVLPSHVDLDKIVLRQYARITSARVSAAAVTNDSKQIRSIGCGQLKASNAKLGRLLIPHIDRRLQSAFFSFSFLTRGTVYSR